jgi:hypothetical protein
LYVKKKQSKSVILKICSSIMRERSTKSSVSPSKVLMVVFFIVSGVQSVKKSSQSLRISVYDG